MQLNVSRILDSLNDMERDFLEADALAQGVSAESIVIELVREGLRVENIDEAFHPVDSQWKSH